jgi:photosystem II stability/assembly factor-like uncharacterized protein
MYLGSGDIDGDGKPDLVVTNYNDNTLSVIRNTSLAGNTSFAAKLDLATVPLPNQLAIGDLDGDGRLDIVVPNNDSHSFSVFRNTSTPGNPSFAARVDFPTGVRSWFASIGDIDRDGRPDLVIANYNNNTFSVFHNVGAPGTISFAPNVDFVTGANPHAVAMGDLDGDGKPDIAVANDKANSFSVYRNTSTIGSITTGSFANKVDFAAPWGLVDLMIGDLDGDGKPDLVATTGATQVLTLYQNTATPGNIGAGSFATGVACPTISGTGSGTMGDLDGDGKPDIVLTSYLGKAISVHCNTSTGGSITTASLATRLDIPLGTYPGNPLIVDLDGDGKPDIAFVDNTNNAVSVFRNTVAAAAARSETEPNNTASQANQITLGDVIDGAFSVAGDVDYFKVNLSAGDTVDITGTNLAGSTVDGFLKLYDAVGNLLEENDDFLSTDASRILYAITSTGTYYIRYSDLSALDAFPTSFGKRSSLEREDVSRLHRASSLLKTERAAAQTGSYTLVVKRVEPSAPQVVTWGAFNIFANSAWFEGNLYPNGLYTTLRVDYGPTTSYGQSRDITPAQESYGAYFLDSLVALYPNATYNYQIVATNSLGYATSANQTFTTPPSPAGWARVQSGVGQFLVSVVFANASVGLIVGDEGTVLKTADGGKSWSGQASGTSEVLRGICMVNLSQAYAVGNNGTILRTDDGGSSWVSQSSGGTTRLSDVHFIDANTGIVVGNGGTILRTINGGSSWQLEPSGTVQHLRGLDFADASLGIAVGYGGTILRTTDGGKSWSSVTSPTTEVLYRVDLVNASVGYTVGFNGVILKTYDGGISWLQQAVGTSESFYNLSFRDENNGLAVATNGEIWRTQDGGTSWFKDESGTWNGLNCAAITPDGTLIVGGDFGTILRKTLAAASLSVRVISPNGGELWNEDMGHRIAWQASDAAGNPITAIQLLYSTDNGVSFTEFYNGAPSTSSRGWQVPRTPTKDALVKVVATNSLGESAEDVSDAPFTIVDVATYVHRTGAIAHTLRNDGYTGSGGGTFDPGEPSLEFPPGSGKHHLYLGQLVLAGVTASGDTLANPSYQDEFLPVDPLAVTPRAVANFVDTRTRYLVKRAPGIQIEEYTLAPTNESYIIIAYKVRNKSSFRLSDAYLALYCDFDLNDYSRDQAGYDDANKLAYVFDATGGWSGYAGIRMLNAQPNSFRRWSNTITEPGTTGGWYRAIANPGNDDPSSDPPADYRLMECSGPFTMAPGDSTSLVFALAVGNGLSGLQSATQRAQQFWDTFTATIAVTSTPSAWATGFTYHVLWTSSNLSGNVNIRLSTDGGNSYVTILANAPNTGSASLTIPASTTPSTNCRLRVESVANAAVYDESGTFTIVSGTLPSTIQLSGNVTFGSDMSSSTSYRLVSLPGNVSSLTVGEVLSGSQKTDWRIYTDNGASSNFLVELSAGSSLGVGQGYWLLKRGGLTISRSVPAVQLSSDATYSVSLHSGWNVIGNPFEKSVSWSVILAANGTTASAATRIQEYSGSYSTASSLEPYKGYYFFNSGNLGSLKVPYPFLGKVQTANQLLPVDWKIQLDFKSDINDDPENFIGIAPAAKEGIDDLESRKPPLFMDQGFLYFERPDWDKSFSLFSSDFRPSLGEGQMWDFTVRNPRRSIGSIRFSGVDGVPMEYAVKLVNLSNTVPVDLRTAADYSYRAAEEITRFKLIIGKKRFVEDQLASVVPDAFELLQNYPNPFNAGTTIVFRTPKESHIQLKIVSLLGQTVRTLMDERLTPGTYTVRWEGTDQYDRPVASGVYFYQLISAGKPIQTKKLTILK